MPIVFFVYGLAFFCLGLAIAVFPRRDSSLAFARDLGLIGAFGILHGGNEWIDLLILLKGPDLPAVLYAMRTVILAASFLCLVTYGVRRLPRPDGLPGSIVPSLPVLLLVVWGTLALTSAQPFHAADIWARYLLGLPGTVLTFITLSSHAREFGEESLRRPRRYIQVSAGTFLAYGVLTGLIVPKADFFPASVINYSAFAGLVGLPVQVFRSICAVCIAVTMVKALGIFDWEAREALRSARDDLELKVRERTRSLIGINEELEQQMAELSRAQRDVQRAKEDWELTFDSAHDAIMILDSECRIRRMNRSMAHLVGLEPEDAVGRYCYELVHQTKEPIADCPHMQMLKDGAVHDIEYFEDTMGRYFSVSISPVCDNGRVTGSIHIMRDVTVRRRSEEEVRKSLREKEVLIREVHHRVKNNMQVISSLLRLQATHVGDEAVRALFRESEDRIRSMAYVHEELYRSQDMSRVDMETYVRNLSRSLYHSYGVDPNRIALTLQVEDLTIGINTAIPCGLILNELISNALKHAFPEGAGGTVTVSLHRGEDGDLVLDVSDDGVGLPAGFDVRKSGSMGLYLVRTLVEMQLEGRMTVEGGPGTRFRIDLHDMSH